MRGRMLLPCRNKGSNGNSVWLSSYKLEVDPAHQANSWLHQQLPLLVATLVQLGTARGTRVATARQLRHRRQHHTRRPARTCRKPLWLHHGLQAKDHGKWGPSLATELPETPSDWQTVTSDIVRTSHHLVATHGHQVVVALAEAWAYGIPR